MIVLVRVPRGPWQRKSDVVIVVSQKVPAALEPCGEGFSSLRGGNTPGRIEFAGSDGNHWTVSHRCLIIGQKVLTKLTAVISYKSLGDLPLRFVLGSGVSPKKPRCHHDIAKP